MSDDILSQMSDDIGHIPTDSDNARMREACRSLVEKKAEAARLEKQAKELKTEAWELETKTIPDLSEELGIDKIGLADYGVDVVVAPYYKANISADWDEATRDSAFRHLDELGVGDIIRTRVEYSLGKDSIEEATKIAEIVESAARQLGLGEIPQPTVGKAVPWNTLTSTVRDLTEKGVAIDLARVGATVGQMAKIRERKD